MGKDSCSYDDAHKQQQPIKPTPTRANKKPIIKITYISSPVTVNARDASEFRAMVQNLTGKGSGTSGICTARKERKVGEVFSHAIHGTDHDDGTSTSTSTTLPQSDIALHDTMPSWLFGQQDCSQTQTLESLVQFLPHQ